MSLHVLVSRKGTRVVTASNLYQALELPPAQYGRAIRHWVRDIYELDGVLRRPEHGRDFAPRRNRDNPSGDYYLSLPLARQIALRTNSRHKLKYALQLQALCTRKEAALSLRPEAIHALSGLARTLSLMSCQIACERHHLALYRRRHKGSAASWWFYRAQLLGYSLEELRRRAAQKGIAARRKSARALLLLFDESELVRTAAFDLFVAMGHEPPYALGLAEAVRASFTGAGWSVCDDRAAGNIFTASVPTDWAQEVYALEAGALLAPLWPSARTALEQAEPARKAAAS